MKTFFKGDLYNFEIICKKFTKSKGSWTLKAISKKTGRYSGINNVNTVLSELGIDEDEICGRFEDSFGWKVSKQVMKKFSKTAKSFLTDKKYLRYLENKLDEDRSQGEWENVAE